VGAATLLVAAGVLWMRDGGRSAPATVTASPPARASGPTIVVFPFENLGPPEDAYFAAGITDEIITSLTGTAGLHVISRTSSRQYDRTGKSMDQIASELGVDYVLEGSVRWQRNDDGSSRVRVTPQLVDAASDEQLWAERYDRAMEEIFTVQSEIAAEVVRNLGVTLAVGSDAATSTAPTADLTAYHAYLRGKEHLDMARFNASTWLLAVDVLEKAVERDPGFHAAWVQLAKANAGLCHFNWDRTEERLARAKRAVDRARALDPDAAATHYAQGIYYYWGLKDYERALTSFRRASELNPDDTDTMEGMAYVLRRQERYAEAAEILVALAERAPQNAPLAMHIAETLAIIERYDEALAWSWRSVEYGPDQPASYCMGAWVGVQADRHDEARRFLDEVPPDIDPEVAYHTFRASLELRDYAAALEHALAMPDYLVTQYQTTSRDLAAGMTYRAMDRHEQARESFARAEAVFAVKVAEHPEAGNLRAARALALAGVGRHDEARAEIQRSFALYPASKDPWIMTWRRWDLAIVQLLAGEHEAAVQTLAELMTRQTDVVSPAILRHSPLLDDLRGREDFQALLAAQS
jgi:TolB-like protein/Flp pilus assembly protein TadD